MKVLAGLLLVSLAVLWALGGARSRPETPAAAAPTHVARDASRGPAADGRGSSAQRVLADTDQVTVRRVWAADVDPWGGISPDGRFLTFTDWNTGNLAVRDLVNDTTRSLTQKKAWPDSSNAYATGSVFSPDGRKIAYAWSNSDDSYTELRLIGVDGSEPQVVLRNREVGYIEPAQWSPDGTSILGELGISGVTKIVLVSVADGTVRVLKTMNWESRGAGLRMFSTMSFSPDGRYIAYDRPSRENSPDRDIFVLASDGSRETPVVQHLADDAVLGWTADGSHLLFASDRTGTPGAWIIPVSGGSAAGEPRVIKPDLWRASPIGFTRNGSFYYAVDVATRDVYVATLDVTTGKLLGTPTRVVQRFLGANHSPDWSPEGRYLAYLSRRAPGRTGSLVIRSTETGEERVLALRLQTVWRPKWSPDGRFVLVTGSGGKGDHGFYLIDAQTGDARWLVRNHRGGGYVQWATWSRDGKQLFYYRRSEKTKHGLYALALETGAERQLYEGGEINEMVASPDGRWLAVVVYKTGELLAIPVAGGEARVLLQLAPGAGGAPLAWTEKGLLYRGDRSRGEPGLWRLPTDGGTPVKFELGDRVRWHPYWAFSLHPDGTRIAFSTGETYGLELWVMEGLPSSEGASSAGR